jgi:filamentous hemagglutinin
MGQGKSGLFTGTKGGHGYVGKTTEESIQIKLSKYLLNPNSIKGKSKAEWFKKALGFSLDNISELSKQIVFDQKKAILVNKDEFGLYYNQIITIKGTNQRVIDIKFGWVINLDGVVRLITAIPSKKIKKETE